MTMLRRGLLAAVAALLVAAPAAMAGASPIYVDDIDGNPADCPATPYTTLNDGIAATPGGGTVIVCPGTYEATLTVDDDDRPVVDKPLTIQGPNAGIPGYTARGPEATLTRTGGDRAGFDRDYGITINGNVDNVTIDGLAFTGALDQAIHFEDPGNLGADATASNIDVLNNRVVGIQGPALGGSIPQATTRQGWNIEDNFVGDWTRANETAFFLSAGSNNGIVVTGNVVDGDPAVTGSRGINLDGATATVVANNTWRNLSRYGVQLANSADGVEIYENEFIGVREGILLRTGTNPLGGPGALRAISIDTNAFEDVGESAVASEPLQAGGQLRDLDIGDNTIDQDAAELVADAGLIDLRFEQGVTNGPARIFDNAITVDGTLNAARTGPYGIRVLGDADNVQILRNSLDGITAGTAGSGGAAGIRLQATDPAAGALTGTIAIRGNSITGWRNGIAIVEGATGAAAAAPGALIDATINRIAGNAAGFTAAGADTGTTAERNWWGCNTGPNTTGCDSVTGGVDVTPWLVLALTATPSEIPQDGGVAILRAGLDQDSAGGAVDTTDFPPATVGFTTTLGEVTPLQPLEQGVANGSLTAKGVAGTATVGATFDNQTVTRDVVITPRRVVQTPPTTTTTTTTTTPAPTRAAEDAPPSVRLLLPAPAGRRLSTLRATSLEATAQDDRGVTGVAFVVNDRTLCRDTTAPYTCAYRPLGRDVGRATIVVVATDTAGQTATDVRGFFHGRFSAPRLTLTAANVRDRREPYRFRVRGRLSLRPGVTRADGCSGSVRLTQRFVDPESGRRVLTTQRASLDRDCTYERTVVVPGGPKRVTLQARFLGNKIVAPETSPERRLRAG